MAISYFFMFEDCYQEFYLMQNHILNIIPSCFQKIIYDILKATWYYAR